MHPAAVKLCLTMFIMQDESDDEYYSDENSAHREKRRKMVKSNKMHASMFLKYSVLIWLLTFLCAYYRDHMKKYSKNSCGK